MTRFPEFVQFKAPAGTTEALNEVAKAEGLASSQILREALAARLATSSAASCSNEKAA